MDTHDVALLMVPLLENPPWVRRGITTNTTTTSSGVGGGGGGGGWQKYIDHKWTDVPSGDLLRLTPCEGQPWLTLHALLLEPDLRRRYALSSHRRGTLARVRRFLNEVLLDQLPLLVDLQRFLDELSVTGADPGADQEHGKLLLEAVPEWTLKVETAALTAPKGWVKGAAASSSSSSAAAAASVLATEDDLLDDDNDEDHTNILRIKSKNKKEKRVIWTWDDCAAYSCATAFRKRTRNRRVGGNVSGSGDAGSDNDGDLAALGEELTENAWDEEVPKCAKCGDPATKRCSKCHNEWYCT
jgi:hypothetical protein